MPDPTIVTLPLTSWPGALRDDADRKPNPFTASDADTRTLLKREARLLGAREIVVQLAISESEIRMDGEPYARAKSKHPGVTVVLPESDQGRISWSTDLYRGGGRWRAGTVRLEGWQVNLRAIALSMEALRAADRHGVMQGRQYAGFRELGSGIVAPERVMTVEEAAALIVGLAKAGTATVDDVIADQGARTRAYRSAAAAHHPDRGGNEDTFRQLNEAREVLERHA